MPEQFVKCGCLWEGYCAGEGEDCEEKDMAEMKRYKLTATPIPRLPLPLCRSGKGDSSEIEPGKQGQTGGGKVFLIMSLFITFLLYF